MPIVTILNVSSNIGFGGYTGQNAGSAGLNDYSSTITSNLTTSFIGLGEINSTVPVTTGFNTYYKMQGFNTSTQQYEVWHSMGTPLYDPPSGNALSNISVVSSWIDR